MQRNYKFKSFPIVTKPRVRGLARKQGSPQHFTTLLLCIKYVGTENVTTVIPVLPKCFQNKNIIILEKNAGSFEILVIAMLNSKIQWILEQT